MPKIFLFYNLVTHRILDTECGSIWTTPWPEQKYYISKLNIWNNSKFLYEKLTFFLGKLYQKFFLHYNLHTIGSLGDQFGSLWTTPWPDEIDLFLKLLICEIRKLTYEKITFFPRQAMPKILCVLQSSYPWDTRYRVWFDLNNSLTRPKHYISKLNIWNNSKFPYEKLTFFLVKLYQKIFLHYNLHTTCSLGYQFGSLWTTPWPDEKDPFLKFVICEIRKFSYEKLTFFLGKLYQKLFLHYNLHTTGSLGYQFGSLWTTPWPHEKDLFLKFLICEIRKLAYEKITFFLGKLCQKFFVFYNLVTHGILDTEFGSIWTTPWPDQNTIFQK